MLDDLFNTDNLVMFNFQLVNKIGLHAAIYVHQLINIQAKARQKDKNVIIDGTSYCCIDRDYINKRTSIDENEQLQLDAKLSKIGMIKIASEDKSLIYVDVSGVANLISEDSPEVLESVSKILRSKVRNTAEKRETKRAAIVRSLKSNITINHPDLRSALEEWVDSVMNKPNGYLSAKGVRDFIQDMDNYAKGNLDIALQVVGIASANGWKNCIPAIESYEKKKRYISIPTASAPIPSIKTRVKLSDEEF